MSHLDRDLKLLAAMSLSGISGAWAVHRLRLRTVIVLVAVPDLPNEAGAAPQSPSRAVDAGGAPQ